MGKLKSGNYIILDVIRTRITFGDWESHIMKNAERDGRDVEIILPLDPNAASKAATSMLVRSIAEQGYVAKMRRSSLGKLDSFRPFAAAAEVGAILMVKDCCTDLWNNITNNNDFFYNELEAFDGKRRSGPLGHDDMVDTCSLAFVFLAQKLNIPNFMHGLKSMDLSVSNPFPRSN
jgi:predicted phage terminase large subunit-like protein